MAVGLRQLVQLFLHVELVVRHVELAVVRTNVELNVRHAGHLDEVPFDRRRTAVADHVGQLQRHELVPAGGGLAAAAVAAPMHPAPEPSPRNNRPGP